MTMVDGAHVETARSNKLLLTVEEAAQVMSLGRTLMYALVMRKQITSIKVERTRRIPLTALEQYVQRLAEVEKGA